VSKELGIPTGVLGRWTKELSKRVAAANGRDAFPGNGKLTSQDEELRRLKRELAVVKEERDFLKKATAFFAKESR
jgi:transposase